MATYKDDLDIIKAAEKDSSKLSLNAITELDNKGLLGMYGGGGSDLGFEWDFFALANKEPRFLAGDYAKLRSKLERAIETGRIDDPLYIGALSEEADKIPGFCITVHIMPSEQLQSDHIEFNLVGSKKPLNFYEDNSVAWGIIK